MMFVLFNSNLKSVTSRTATANPPTALVPQYLAFRVVFVYLSILIWPLYFLFFELRVLITHSELILKRGKNANANNDYAVYIVRASFKIGITQLITVIKMHALP
jgi:hypothetical protein